MVEDRDTLGLVGRHLDDLLVKEVIGEGGYFFIYQAEALQGKYGDHNKEVAVKILKPEYASDSFLTAQTVHEAKVLSGLDHPGIIKCFDYQNFYVGDITYLPGMILEYFKGRDLDEHIKNDLGKKISIFDKASIMLKLAYSIDYLHDHDTMHLEIQPSNILLGGNETKLIDFTFVKSISKPQPNHKTGNGKSAKTIVFGNRDFVAPEVHSEQENPASDVYSLGLVFYCLMANQCNPPEQFTPQNLVIDLPQQVKGLIFSMIQPVYQDRPTMKEVVNELESKIKVHDIRF